MVPLCEVSTASKASLSRTSLSPICRSACWTGLAPSFRPRSSRAKPCFITYWIKNKFLSDLQAFDVKLSLPIETKKFFSPPKLDLIWYYFVLLLRASEIALKAAECCSDVTRLVRLFETSGWWLFSFGLKVWVISDDLLISFSDGPIFWPLKNMKKK